MPLARIFTRNPERTSDLSRQLKQQGYTVEVASPELSDLAPADLEIEFEVCERADVLERAADLASELGADVAVAPGVLQPAEAPAARSVVKMKAPVPPERDREREFDAAFRPVIEMPLAATESPAAEAPVEHEPLPPVAFLDETPRMEPVAIAENQPVAAPVTFSEPPRPADPVPYLAQLTPFSTPAGRSEEPMPAGQTHEPEHERGRQIIDGGARIAARAWAGALALKSSAAASVRDYFQEYSKRAQVRSAEARAAHAARLLDLEQRRAEAQQRAAELEAAREEAARRLVELVRERDPGLHERHERENVPVSFDSTYAANVPEEFQPAAQVPEPAFVEPSRTATWTTPIALWRKINPALRPVLTGAAAVTALFIMGIALGLFHSRAPLANPANPSGGVTVQTGGVTVQTGPAKPQPGKFAANAQAPATPAPAGATAPAQAKTPAPAKPSPRGQHAQQLVAQQSESTIGDDVVIRHFSRPVPTQKPKQSGQQAGLKHFSDLEN
jgi:hypothetical protein